MPHDCNGLPLEIGSDVIIGGRVVGIVQGEDKYCNVTIQASYVMKPDNTTTQIHLNARQVEKITNTHCRSCHGGDLYCECRCLNCSGAKAMALHDGRKQ